MAPLAPAALDTKVVVLAAMSRTITWTTSPVGKVLPPRLGAAVSNTTNRPSLEMIVGPLSPSPVTPAVVCETRVRLSVVRFRR